MSLQQTYARLPITDEPVDGYLVAGALLVLLAAAGLLTGVLPLALCGMAAIGAVVLLKLSGRRPRDVRRPAGAVTAAPADAVAQPAG